jgi:hypothetical protein
MEIINEDPMAGDPLHLRKQPHGRLAVEVMEKEGSVDDVDGIVVGKVEGILNLDADSPVTDSATTADDLVYDDLQEGVAELEENDAEPDMAFFGPRGKADILKYLADRGTDLGDEAVETGQFGAFAGLDFMFSTTGDITAHDAILVDSDRYGYEATFTPVQTEQDDDFDRDTEKYKVKTRKGFKAIKPEAAVKVEG